MYFLKKQLLNQNINFRFEFSEKNQIKKYKNLKKFSKKICGGGYIAPGQNFFVNSVVSKEPVNKFYEEIFWVVYIRHLPSIYSFGSA